MSFFVLLEQVKNTEQYKFRKMMKFTAHARWSIVTIWFDRAVAGGLDRDSLKSWNVSLSLDQSWFFTFHLPKQLDCTGSNAICHMIEMKLAFCEIQNGSVRLL